MNVSDSKTSKIAMINDLTGFGHCSLAVAIPIVSVMEVQACPVPTGIFSNHMAFSDWYNSDFTPKVPDYLAAWEKLSLGFDGILCGFLGNESVIPALSRFFNMQKEKYHSVILLDPVMGDHGKAYSSVTSSYRQALFELCRYADILTPNLTEACFLTGLPYPAEILQNAAAIPVSEETGMPAIYEPLKELLQKTAHKLHVLGIPKIVITGIQLNGYFGNYIYDSTTCKEELLLSQAGGPSRPGTGDIFAAILAADAVNGISFRESVKKAAEFVRICTEGSAALNIPIAEGVCLEKYLHLLQ